MRPTIPHREGDRVQNVLGRARGVRADPRRSSTSVGCKRSSCVACTASPRRSPIDIGVALRDSEPLAIMRVFWGVCHLDGQHHRLALQLARYLEGGPWAAIVLGTDGAPGAYVTPGNDGGDPDHGPGSRCRRSDEDLRGDQRDRRSRRRPAWTTATSCWSVDAIRRSGDADLDHARRPRLDDQALHRCTASAPRASRPSSCSRTRCSARARSSTLTSINRSATPSSRAIAS